MNERTASLRERFRDRAGRDLERLRRHLADDDLAAAAVEETAHKLAGMAAIFGFDEVGEAARAVDRIFSAGDRPHREVLEMLVARLAEAVRPAAAEGPPRDRQVAPGEGETILLVEDDDLIRAHAERQLRSFGYRVIAVADGDALLAKEETLPPVDLLFTDLMLPGEVDGRALARAMRQARPGLRVLFTSGRSANADAEIPPGDFLAKPYRREALAEMVRAVLDREIA